MNNDENDTNSSMMVGDLNRLQEALDHPKEPPQKLVEMMQDVEMDTTIPDDFWKKAKLVHPARKKRHSVHLKLEKEVFDFFYNKNNGHGHLIEMQNVLYSYMMAKKKEKL